MSRGRTLKYALPRNPRGRIDQFSRTLCASPTRQMRHAQKTLHISVASHPAHAVAIVAIGRRRVFSAGDDRLVPLVGDETGWRAHARNRRHKFSDPERCDNAVNGYNRWPRFAEGRTLYAINRIGIGAHGIAFEIFIRGPLIDFS